MRAFMRIAKENSDPIRFFVTWVTVFCLSGDVGASILLAHSLEVTISIMNFMIHDDADFLSCRALFRRPLLCYCRRFVSGYVPFFVSNQFIIIGLRMKWRVRILSFPSAFWFGDEIWIFDPGIIGSRIDNEGKLISFLMQTPVHNIVSRQCQRIWWRVISLFLIFRLYYGKLLACLSLSITEFGRLPIVSLRLWGCQSGSGFMRWYSLFHHSWTLKWKRCNGRLIAKLWKRITRYGEIVTEGVCRSTRLMSEAVANSAIDVLLFPAWMLINEAIRRRIKRPNHQYVEVRRRHNTSSRSFFMFQREADVLTMTSKSRHQLKVMLKAFWSLSYMLLAINIKYMKGGPISHSLIARKAYVQQAGLTHSIIEVTASHICEKRLYSSSLSLLYEKICVSSLVYPNDVLFC